MLEPALGLQAYMAGACIGFFPVAPTLLVEGALRRTESSLGVWAATTFGFETELGGRFSLPISGSLFLVDPKILEIRTQE
jgi:hypothetical protein